MSLLVRFVHALPRPVFEGLDRLRRRSRVISRLYVWLRGSQDRVMTIEKGIGTGLKIDLNGAVLRYGLGLAEEPVQEAMREHVRAGSVFYDVGANVGFLALIAARLTGPTGRVIAFEPVPDTVQQLTRNLEINGFSHVEIVEAAVGDAEGRARLHLEESSQTSHFSTLSGTGAVTGEIDVEVVTLDRFVEKGHPPPDVVKMDIEGAEVLALKGMATVMATYRPTIICEIHGTLQPVTDILQGHGYVTRQLASPYGVSLDHIVAVHPQRS